MTWNKLARRLNRRDYYIVVDTPRDIGRCLGCLFKMNYSVILCKL